jgi:hypothetical protein
MMQKQVTELRAIEEEMHIKLTAGLIGIYAMLKWISDVATHTRRRRWSVDIECDHQVHQPRSYEFAV